VYINIMKPLHINIIFLTTELVFGNLKQHFCSSDGLLSIYTGNFGPVCSNQMKMYYVQFAAAKLYKSTCSALHNAQSLPNLIHMKHS